MPTTTNYSDPNDPLLNTPTGNIIDEYNYGNKTYPQKPSTLTGLPGESSDSGVSGAQKNPPTRADIFNKMIGITKDDSKPGIGVLAVPPPAPVVPPEQSPTRVDKPSVASPEQPTMPSVATPAPQPSSDSQKKGKVELRISHANGSAPDTDRVTPPAARLNDAQSQRLAKHNERVNIALRAQEESAAKATALFSQLQSETDPEKAKKLAVAYTQARQEQERYKLNLVAQKQNYNDVNRQIKQNVGVSGGNFTVSDNNKVVFTPKAQTSDNNKPLSYSEKVDKYKNNIKTAQTDLKTLKTQAGVLSTQMSTTSDPEQLKQLAGQYQSVTDQQQKASVKLATSEKKLENVRENKVASVQNNDKSQMPKAVTLTQASNNHAKKPTTPANQSAVGMVTQQPGSTRLPLPPRHVEPSKNGPRSGVAQQEGVSTMPKVTALTQTSGESRPGSGVRNGQDNGISAVPPAKPLTQTGDLRVNHGQDNHRGGRNGRDNTPGSVGQMPKGVTLTQTPAPAHTPGSADKPDLDIPRTLPPRQIYQNENRTGSMAKGVGGGTVATPPSPVPPRPVALHQEQRPSAPHRGGGNGDSGGNGGPANLPKPAVLTQTPPSRPDPTPAPTHRPDPPRMGGGGGGGGNNGPANIPRPAVLTQTPASRPAEQRPEPRPEPPRMGGGGGGSNDALPTPKVAIAAMGGGGGKKRNK